MGMVASHGVGGRDHWIMRHDFTGRWLAECHAIGCRSPVCFMYHVWRVTEFQGRAPGVGKGNGNWEKRFHGAAATRRWEHLIRKQMSLPKHALPRRVLHIYCSKEFSLVVRGQLAISWLSKGEGAGWKVSRTRLVVLFDPLTTLVARGTRFIAQRVGERRSTLRRIVPGCR